MPMFGSSPCWFLVPGEICICWCGRWPCEVCSSHCSHHLSYTVPRQILTEGENQPLGATIAGGAVIDLGGPQHRHQRCPTCLPHPPLSPLLKHWIFISSLFGKSLHDLYSANLGKVSQCPEKAPTRAFSLLKAPTSAFTIKNLFRHCAK